MKRLLSCFLLMSLLLSFSGCVLKSTPTLSSVKEITSASIKVTSVTPITTEIPTTEKQTEPPVDYTAERNAAKAEIQKYIDANNYDFIKSFASITQIKNEYFAIINTAEKDFVQLTQKATILIDLILINDLYDFKVAEINNEYNPKIEEMTIIINNILSLGIYPGAEYEYKNELEKIRNDRQEAEIMHRRMMKYFPEQMAAQGIDSGMGIYHSIKKQREKEFNDTMKASTDYQNYIEAQWQRRLDYETAIGLNAQYNTERDTLLQQEYTTYNRLKDSCLQRLSAL